MRLFLIYLNSFISYQFSHFSYIFLQKDMIYFHFEIFLATISQLFINFLFPTTCSFFLSEIEFCCNVCFPKKFRFSFVCSQTRQLTSEASFREKKHFFLFKKYLLYFQLIFRFVFRYLIFIFSSIWFRFYYSFYFILCNLQ